ncbi:hypothetical protein CANARDRAFT_9096 [[Candida] arabinofermentans NRRL YB-2248]|uniref:Altered inheritance of mitochondria protein 23, mitochondrial n=1 Tax=[Candida] arabinofermentans NRRL YB-2248 TaxID=983967 RepID=A0A1E4SXA0_9ASCO|nr:hypothetical protein CANARDRAFT_9096 [[Candida] arabinofermentans NRRL YB-2248]
MSTTLVIESVGLLSDKFRIMLLGSIRRCVGVPRDVRTFHSTTVKRVSLDDFLKAAKTNNNNANGTNNRISQGTGDFASRKPNFKPVGNNQQKANFQKAPPRSQSQSQNNNYSNNNNHNSTRQSQSFQAPRSNRAPQSSSNSRYPHKSNRKQQRTSFVDQLTTGTTKAKECIIHIIEQCRKINRSGQIYLVPLKGGQPTLQHVVQVAKSINLDNEGLIIVKEHYSAPGAASGNERHQPSLVKVVDKLTAMKAYSDYQAAKITSSISWNRKMEANNAAAAAATASTTSGEGETKIIRVSWQITINDLSGQKRQEIVSQINKGYRVQVILDHVENFSRERRIANFGQRDQPLGDLEFAKREKIMGLIESKLEEMGCSFTKEGKTQDMITYIIKPIKKEKASASTNDNGNGGQKMDEKQRKKQEKLEKQRAKEERAAKRKEEVKMLTVDEFSI